MVKTPYKVAMWGFTDSLLKGYEASRKEFWPRLIRHSRFKGDQPMGQLITARRMFNLSARLHPIFETLFVTEGASNQHMVVSKN